MSQFLTYTIDEFMALSPDAHRLAVKMFHAQIGHLSRLRQLDVPGSPDDLAHRAEHDLLTSLRKVHQGRLDEQETEIAAASTELNGAIAVAA